MVVQRCYNDRIVTIKSMKKYTMLCAGCVMIAINVYGLVICFVFQPIAVAVVVVSALTAGLISYIELNKRRVLVERKERQSFILFGLLIVLQLYFAITALSLLVYLSIVEKQKEEPASNLNQLIVGVTTLQISLVERLNLPLYVGNFLLLMFYLRCYYTMFWSENIVFIYRYLKSKVQYLNKSLLSHLPKVQVTNELKQSICSLCLQEYNSTQEVTRLYCKHYFHLDCIKVWVMRSNCCPLCRHKVVL